MSTVNRSEKFLVNSGSMRLKYMRFYLQRVPDFCTFTGEGEAVPVSNAQKKHYLTHIAKDHEDWQVAQANVAYDRA